MSESLANVAVRDVESEFLQPADSTQDGVGILLLTISIEFANYISVFDCFIIYSTIFSKSMLYDFLFDIENVNDIPEGKTFDDYLNKSSVTKIENAKIEESLSLSNPGDKFQFVRTGYFVKDTKNENTFNRIVGLKDSFPKQTK